VIVLKIEPPRHRHCEEQRDEAIQIGTSDWIAFLRSQ
jgi:hypothetical protein